MWVVGGEGVASVLRECGETVLVGEEEKGREEVVSRVQAQLASVAR